MRLTLQSLPHYLLSKGFLKSDTIVNGQYIAHQFQTRNIIFTVNTGEGTGLFVKQINNPEQGSLYVLQKDATCLWMIHNIEAFSRLRKFVPEYLGYDASNQILLTALLENAQNIETYLNNKNELTESLLTKIIHLFNSFHFKVDDKVLKESSVGFFPKQIPWAMDVKMITSEERQRGLSITSMPNPALQYASSNSYIIQEISSLKDTWNASSLIHGDVKWMNILINPDENIYLIDWEIADIGDPVWDVAGVLQGIITRKALNEQHLDTSYVIQNEELWKKANFFIKGYMKECGKTSVSKILQYTAARFLQTATEYNIGHTYLIPQAQFLVALSQYFFTNIDSILEKLSP